MICMFLIFPNSHFINLPPFNEIQPHWPSKDFSAHSLLPQDFRMRCSQSLKCFSQISAPPVTLTGWVSIQVPPPQKGLFTHSKEDAPIPNFIVLPPTIFSLKLTRSYNLVDLFIYLFSASLQ